MQNKIIFAILSKQIIYFRIVQCFVYSIKKTPDNLVTSFSINLFLGDIICTYIYMRKSDVFPKIEQIQQKWPINFSQINK